MKRALIFLLLISCSFAGTAQNNGGRLSGKLHINANVFLRDSLIGAANTPQFDHQFFGSESWLNLNYSNWGFDFGLRFDFFQNSNLRNPKASFSGEGVGMWTVRKQVDKLDFTLGYIYDQVGSGIIFRSYEERGLPIDNALLGIRGIYNFNEDWNVKVFSGKQKQLFSSYESLISGLNLEGFIVPKEEGMMTLAPGFGFVNRTLDDNSMNALVASLGDYGDADLFVPQYNTYAFTLYNTLSLGSFNWYVEGAYKSSDNIVDLEGERVSRFTGDTIVGSQFVLEEGSVLFSSLSFSKNGFGISLEGKRTENFSFRTRPQESLNNGLVNFLPPMARTHTYRLLARYAPATQDKGELALKADVRYAPSKKMLFNASYSHIVTLDNAPLYDEYYFEYSYKPKRTFKLTTGVQMQKYNQEVFEFKPNVPIVETITPFVDIFYKLNKKRSIRFEGQYMVTGEKDGVKHDFGDWIYGGVEYNFSNKFSLSVTDMYNVAPGKNSPTDDSGEKLAIHYPRIDVFYVTGPTRMSIGYVKQVQGIVCSGGVCRLEPAFSGVRANLTTSF